MDARLLGTPAPAAVAPSGPLSVLRISGGGPAPPDPPGPPPLRSRTPLPDTPSHTAPSVLQRARRPPLLVYDGECGFCTAVIDWLEARLERPVRLVPWQRTDLGELGLRPEDARRSVWWIEPGGERVHSERAMARVLACCGAPWSGMGRLIALAPVRPFAALAYRFVARIRGHLPGTTPACERDGPA